MKNSGGHYSVAVELLAPAGSVEALRAACIAGADAVYIGGNRFGARAYADNPDQEELLEAIRLVHRLGKKLYLTVNTLLKNDELSEVCAWMRPYYEAGVDAVIVQDLGVVQVFREVFPDLPLHASTQMAVTGPDGVRLLRKLGICRVVPARELSLAELKEIRKETGIELETFIHGALCYSYSGQCLMSSMIGGRSGNRGRCAGICRLPYRLPEYNRGNSRDSYPLNMKDLCTLDLLPQLTEAGISSFKIEGRMKKPEYTAGVVSVYRRALDMLTEGNWNEYDPSQDRALLTALYNRDGFTDGYYTRHNGCGMIALNNEKLQGKRAAEAQKATEEIRKKLTDKESARSLQMPISGQIRLHAGQPAFCSLTASLKKTGNSGVKSIFAEAETGVVEKARTAPTSEEEVRTQFLKTGGSPFRFTKLQTNIDSDVFLSVREIKNLRRKALEELDSRLMREYIREKVIEESGRRFSNTSEQNAETEEAAPESGHRIYVSVLSEKQAEAVLQADEDRRPYAVCLPQELQHLTEKMHRKGIHTVLAMPYVFRREFPEQITKTEASLTCGSWDAVLVRTLEEAGMIMRLREKSCSIPENVILDATVYTMNNTAAEVFEELGFTIRTLPYELSFKELRSQKTSGCQLVVYGRTPMMISAQCIRKTNRACTHRSGWTAITDRTGRTFPVYCSCPDCFTIIYNSLPTSLFREQEAIRHLHCGSVRVDLTDERKEETMQLLSAVTDCFGRRETRDAEVEMPDIPVTRGHFRRGIE